MIGQLLSGRYRIIRTLAAGGMGQTYIAEDTQRPGNPRCVVKQLKPASGNTIFLTTARRLFSREAEILEQLGHHDQIPRLLAYFEQDEEFYVIQEFIDGQPLSVELAIGSRWTERQVIQFLQEILQLLEFVHSQNVIHRDIKPDNLIRRRQDGKLVLIDFGAVKQVRIQPLTTVGQTNITISIGTPGYMPTEQSKGKPCLSSDIYALGMIGIRALTGVHPSDLPEDDDGEVIWRDKAEVSDELAAVLTKMARYYHKRRYQSATEVLQALEPLIVAHGLTSNRSAPNFYQPPQIEANRNGFTAADKSEELLQRRFSVPSRLSQSEWQDVSTFISPTTPAGSDVAVAAPVPVVPATLTGPPPQRWKRIGLAAGLLGFALISGTLSYWYLQQRQALQPIQSLKAAENYDECIRQAEALSRQGNLLVKSLLGECYLSKAKLSADKGQFRDAIKIASAVPSGNPMYREARQAINQWTQQTLNIAEKEYQNGNLDTAIAIANTVPEDSQFFQSAQDSIKQWNQNWQTNEKYIERAQQALDERQWLTAIDAARQVTTTYWTEQAAGIIQEANAAIAAARPTLKPTQETPQPTPSSQSFDSIPRRSNRSMPQPTQTDPGEAPIFEVPNQDDSDASPTPEASPQPAPTQTPSEPSPTSDSATQQAPQNAPLVDVPNIFK